jgi:hypothetical protein
MRSLLSCMYLPVKHLKMSAICFMISIVALYHLGILSLVLSDGLFKLGFGLLIAKSFLIESIEDKQIWSLAGPLRRDKSPKIYWTTIISFSVFLGLFFAYAICVILSAFMGQRTPGT